MRRAGAKGDFATATLRVATEDDAILVSLIAFGDAAETVLAHRQGAALAVAGRARLSSWTGKDGTERHGLSVVAEQVASASAARRAARNAGVSGLKPDRHPSGAEERRRERQHHPAALESGR